METVKLIHISCVALTALFFLGRGIVMMRNPEFVGRGWVRGVAQKIDTLLLLSGVTLVWLSGQLPWQEMWLAAKLTALVVYILLGMVAFHWGKDRSVKFGAWVLAMAVLAMMVSMALSRSPWPF